MYIIRYNRKEGRHKKEKEENYLNKETQYWNLSQNSERSNLFIIYKEKLFDAVDDKNYWAMAISSYHPTNPIRLIILLFTTTVTTTDDMSE